MKLNEFASKALELFEQFECNEMCSKCVFWADEQLCLEAAMYHTMKEVIEQ